MAGDPKDDCDIWIFDAQTCTFHTSFSQTWLDKPPLEENVHGKGLGGKQSQRSNQPILGLQILISTPLSKPIGRDLESLPGSRRIETGPLKALHRRLLDRQLPCSQPDICDRCAMVKTLCGSWSWFPEQKSICTLLLSNTPFQEADHRP